MAAAMTYFTMLSLAPLLTMAIAIAGYFFESSLAQETVVDHVSAYTTEDVAKTIAGLIKNASRPSSGLLAGVLSIVVLIFAASGAFTQMHDTFDDIWHIPIAKRMSILFTLRQRVVGILMVLVAGLLLLSLLVQSAVVTTISSWLADNYPQAVPWLRFADRGVSFLLMPVVFSMLFWLVPSAKVRFQDVWLAGMLTAVLCGTSRFLIELYLDFFTANEVYGAAGSLVILLVWVYMMAMVVFYGAAFSHAYSVTFGSRRDQFQSQETMDPEETMDPVVRDLDDEVESIEEEKLEQAKKRLREIVLDN